MMFKKLNLAFQILSNTIVISAIFSFVFLPVAQGAAAEKHQQLISKSEIQTAFLKSGLNKSMTVSEFYQKNKKLFPVESLNSINEFVKSNGDQRMPEFEVSSSKNTNGEEVPVVRILQNGELISVNIYGDPNVYAQFDGIKLSAEDFINFNNLPEKVYSENLRLRKKTDSPDGLQKSIFQYPAISATVLKSMTEIQRAEYILNMRLLWNDARSVLFQIDKIKSKKSSPTNSLFQFFIADAQAANKAQSGQDCLVAGYVTQYTGKICDQNKIKDNYANDSLFASAATFCKSPQISCNPLVFGAPNGQPTCITPGKADFQIATHYEGPCERNAHLGTKVKFLKDENKFQGRYEANNILLNEAQIADQLKKDQSENLAATKDFISGILKFQNKELSEAFTKGNFSDQLLNKLKEIRENFNTEIGKAKSACEAASSENKKYSADFWGACDQMQRRTIFIAEYLSKNPGCKSGQPVNPESLKCSCVNSKESEVNPGVSCTAVAAKLAEGTKPSVEKPKDMPVAEAKDEKKKSAASAVESTQKIDSAKDKKEETVWYKKPTTWMFGLLGVAAVVFVAKPLYTYKKTGLCSDGKPSPCKCNLGSESFCVSIGSSKQ